MATGITSMADARSRVVSTSEIVGMLITDTSGSKLGHIKEIFADNGTGEIKFVLATSGGFFGGGDKYHPLPWSLLRLNASAEGYVAALSKDQLKDAPAYDRDQLSSPNYAWDEQVHRYFETIGLPSNSK